LAEIDSHFIMNETREGRLSTQFQGKGPRGNKSGENIQGETRQQETGEDETNQEATTVSAELN
jgi:hypothetical protein